MGALEEVLVPDSVQLAIVELQLALMITTEHSVAGENPIKVIELAQSIDDKVVAAELAALRSTVNHELRHTSRDQYRVVHTLKALSSRMA